MSLYRLFGVPDPDMSRLLRFSDEDAQGRLLNDAGSQGAGFQGAGVPQRSYRRSLKNRGLLCFAVALVLVVVGAVCILPVFGFARRYMWFGVGLFCMALMFFFMGVVTVRLADDLSMRTFQAFWFVTMFAKVLPLVLGLAIWRQSKYHDVASLLLCLLFFLPNFVSRFVQDHVVDVNSDRE